jgi:pyrimidine operon attenuation protein / uracil phosphoribosyltransferase
MTSLSSLPDAETLYATLLALMRAHIAERTITLVGITSGGAWLAERLHKNLGLITPLGIISSALHRDDYSTRGMSSAAQTQLPFEVGGADIVLIDDVLHTGRTLRAVINELYDFGRPKRVSLAVLVDRGGRELPIQADVVAQKLSLNIAPAQHLRLQRDEQTGRLSFEV